jgi:hypothetical protein
VNVWRVVSRKGGPQLQGNAIEHVPTLKSMCSARSRVDEQEAPINPSNATFNSPEDLVHGPRQLQRVPRVQLVVLCLAGWGVAGRAHGRFRLRTVGGRDVRILAHRFGYALEHGPDALMSARVLGYGCDNPLCQRIDPEHVRGSTHTLNRRE